MKVALYARNSRAPRGWKPSMPGEEPPGSWKVQLAALGQWATAGGHVVTSEEHDADVSGKDPNRPGWQRTLAVARGHHCEAVATTKLDRVMRSSVHYHATVDEFLRLGIDLIFIDNDFRISKRDPMSKFLLSVLAAVAELELDLARERMMANMEWRDGRLYGPRSATPAGRPTEYGPEHRFRVRGGRPVHDKARCQACGVSMGPRA